MARPFPIGASGSSLARVPAPTTRTRRPAKRVDTDAAYSAAVHSLHIVAPAFVELAHRIVWSSVATVDVTNRPRTRILHPLWEWDGTALVGWIATRPTALKRRHIAHSPFISCAYRNDEHDSAAAECRVEWRFDDATRFAVYKKFKKAAPPLGFDPAIVEGWEHPMSDEFAVWRLEPWHLRVTSPDYMLTAGVNGQVLSWTGQD
jgi:hypothetical protein